MISLVTLFITSISLLGFISLFIIFRYRTIDIYVDNKKSALRSLLEKEIQKHPKITVYIQSLGKNQKETKLLKKYVKSNKEMIEVIEEFNKQIKVYRRKRIRLIITGLISIVLWTCLSIALLYDFFSEKDYVLLFFVFLLVTLFFIIVESLEAFVE